MKDSISKSTSRGLSGSWSRPVNRPELIDELQSLLKTGDIVVDGGNSDDKDTQRRAAALNERGISLIDVGTSGGVWGLTEGTA